MYFLIFVIKQRLLKFGLEIFSMLTKFEPKQILLRYLQRLIPSKALTLALERQRRRLIAMRISILTLCIATVMTICGYPYFQDHVKIISQESEYFSLPDLNHLTSKNSLHNYELYSNSKLNLTFHNRPQPFEKDLGLTLPATFDPQKLAKSFSKLEYIANPIDFSSLIEVDFFPNLRPVNIAYTNENIQYLPENYIYCGNFSFEILAKSLKNKLPKIIYDKTQVLPYKNDFYLKIGPFFKHHEAKVLASNLKLNPYTPSCLIANF